MLICTMICCSGLGIYFGISALTQGASDFARGLTAGVLCGLEVTAVFNLVRLFMISHDDEKLKQLYITETDERNISIEKESAKKSQLIIMFGIAVADIVFGYFDETVAKVLSTVLMLSAVVTIAVRKYYDTKM